MSSKRLYDELPGVPEKTWFPHRADVSASGVHRPLMAGIAGGAHEPAESVIVSGGYEDDEDLGDEILYTGQGGNDPVTKKQVADQDLVRGNRALARNLLEGVPVRVVRGSRHDSPHAPAAGYRYDGLFRVEACWHETGKSGFRVWRFCLRKAEEAPPGSVAETKGEYEAGPPAQQAATIARVIRSTGVAQRVKRLHHFVCQVCGVRLETLAGPYAEAAHIRPLGAPHHGPDTADNILCLCPNHHVLFDLGGFTLDDDLRISSDDTRLRTAKRHAINPEHVRYHREHYG